MTQQKSQDWGLLACDAVLQKERFPAFRQDVLRLFSGGIWAKKNDLGPHDLLRMKAIPSFNTPETLHTTRQRYISEDQNPQLHCCKNSKLATEVTYDEFNKGDA